MKVFFKDLSQDEFNYLKTTGFFNVGYRYKGSKFYAQLTNSDYVKIAENGNVARIEENEVLDEFGVKIEAPIDINVENPVENPIVETPIAENVECDKAEEAKTEYVEEAIAEECVQNDFITEEKFETRLLDIDKSLEEFKDKVRSDLEHCKEEIYNRLKQEVNKDVLFIFEKESENIRQSILANIVKAITSTKSE